MRKRAGNIRASPLHHPPLSQLGGPGPLDWTRAMDERCPAFGKTATDLHAMLPMRSATTAASCCFSFFPYCFRRTDLFLQVVGFTKLALGLSYSKQNLAWYVCICMYAGSRNRGGYRNLELDKKIKHPNTWLLVRPSRALPRLIRSLFSAQVLPKGRVFFFTVVVETGLILMVLPESRFF